MKLAFVNASYQFGGAETVARDLVDGCARAGQDTRLYVAAGKSYSRDAAVVPLYPRILSRLHHSRLRPLVEGVAPRAAWTDRQFRSLAHGWPDVVHLHSFHGDYATLDSLAYVTRHKPLVWTFHAHWGVTGGCDHPLDCGRYEDACGECPRLGVWPLGSVDDTAAQLQAKLRYLGDLPLHVVAPSRFLAERVARSRVGRRWKVEHIPNGIATEGFSGARKEDATLSRELGLDPSRVPILVVNRNFRDREKGFDLVREALTAIAPAGRAQVILVGEGSDWAASTLPATLQPISCGYLASRAAVARLFEAAAIFLFASPAENFPCAILEAMASECCVVSTPTSGVTEQIEDGRTGLLAAEISGAALAAALSVAVADAPLRRRLGYAARERVTACYTRDLMVRRHLELYERITSTAAR
jgi:glycosyltransferase involved in cell wall biosynthesis